MSTSGSDPGELATDVGVAAAADRGMLPLLDLGSAALADEVLSGGELFLGSLAIAARHRYHRS